MNPEEEENIISIFKKYDLIKKGTFIFSEKSIPNKISVSKFGGPIPKIKNSSENDSYVPKCKVCQKEMEILSQLYIPDLPSEIKNTLPEDLKESLIVLFICAEDIPCETQSNLDYKIYSKEDIPNLEYVESKVTKPKIECSVFNKYEEFDTYGDKLDSYMEIREKEKFDEVKLEELMWTIRKERRKGSRCYFGGLPNYDQSETNPGEEYELLLNIQDDINFSLMWGDAGSAQIWVKKKNEENRFLLTWQCG